MHKFLLLRATRTLAVVVVSLLAFSSSCTYSKGEEPIPCTDTAPVTYSGVISPIFDANCRTCHNANDYKTLGGGNDYSTHAGILLKADKLLGCVEHRAGSIPMPRGGDKLPACDIAKIKIWVEAGLPNN